MKALKTKVILSGIVLVFAFIATIGTTFAWFTISETVAVDGINLQVTSSDNLLVRVDTGGEGSTDTFETGSPIYTISNYQSSLSLTDITDVPKYSDIGTWRMNPVTAINQDYASIDAKSLFSIDDGYTTRNLTSTSLKNSDAGGFIELHFWLYSQASEDRPIELVSTSITPNTSESTQLQAVANAVRFGIWMNDNVQGAGDAYIYGNDTDFGFEFLLGQAGYDAAYLFNALSDTGKFVEYIDVDDLGNVAFTPMIDGSNQLLDTVTGYDNVFQLTGNNDHSNDIYTITPGVPTLVTVRIFIEGFDAQATNAVVNATFDISIGFAFGTVDV